MELKITVVKPPPPVDVLMFIKPEEPLSEPENQFYQFKRVNGPIGNDQFGFYFTLGERQIHGGEHLMVKFPNGKVHEHEICVSDDRMWLRANFRGLKIAFEVDENDGLSAYPLPKK